jgi:hypothetical protein
MGVVWVPFHTHCSTPHSPHLQTHPNRKQVTYGDRAHRAPPLYLPAREGFPWEEGRINWCQITGRSDTCHPSCHILTCPLGDVTV